MSAQVAGSRPVPRAHTATSAHSHAGRPPTVHRGSGNVTSRRRIRQASTALRVTPRRWAISTVPTGSQAIPRSVCTMLTSEARCAHNTYMANSENTIKTRHQLRRAHKLVNVIDTMTPGETHTARHAIAQALRTDAWTKAATLAGITAPSITTVTMALGLLEARVVNEQMTAIDAFAGFPQ